MTEKTKTLRMNFIAGDGKKKNISLANPAEGLKSTEVQAQMGKISDAHVFEKAGVDLYNVPDSADYIERVVTNIFGGEDPDDDNAEQANAASADHQAN